MAAGFESFDDQFLAGEVIGIMNRGAGTEREIERGVRGVRGCFLPGFKCDRRGDFFRGILHGKGIQPARRSGPPIKEGLKSREERGVRKASRIRPV